MAPKELVKLGKRWGRARRFFRRRRRRIVAFLFGVGIRFGRECVQGVLPARSPTTHGSQWRFQVLSPEKNELYLITPKKIRLWVPKVCIGNYLEIPAVAVLSFRSTGNPYNLQSSCLKNGTFLCFQAATFEDKRTGGIGCFWCFWLRFVFFVLGIIYELVNMKILARYNSPQLQGQILSVFHPRFIHFKWPQWTSIVETGLQIDS